MIVALCYFLHKALAPNERGFFGGRFWQTAYKRLLSL